MVVWQSDARLLCRRQGAAAVSGHRGDGLGSGGDCCAVASKISGMGFSAAARAHGCDSFVWTLFDFGPLDNSCIPLSAALLFDLARGVAAQEFECAGTFRGADDAGTGTAR